MNGVHKRLPGRQMGLIVQPGAPRRDSAIWGDRGWLSQQQAGARLAQTRKLIQESSIGRTILGVIRWRSDQNQPVFHRQTNLASGAL